MKKFLAILLLLYAFSCNPYQPYYFTHYHINASYHPETRNLSANVQMVLVAEKTYHDSIVFLLNGSVEILSLTAQELKYYEFENGRLVLNIEEVVMPGDQLHISMSYEGKIGQKHGQDAGLTLEKYWYPVNRDIHKLTYEIELGLPEQYRMEAPGVQKGRTWQWGTREPQGSIAVPIAAY